MERLFSPCTRYRDIAESQEDGVIGFQEFPEELNLDVSTAEFLSADRAFTYADLYAKLRNRKTIAWLTPHSFVARRNGPWLRLYDASGYFCLNADGKVIDALAKYSEHLLEICDVVLRLLAASGVHSVHLSYWIARDGTFINSASLAYLMEQCQSLKVLTLEKVALDENHCRVLGAYSRPGLEINLEDCAISSAGARALAEILGRNQGPTKLDFCNIDNFVIAEGLRGNSRLKSLTPRIPSNSGSPSNLGNRGVLAIAGALRENKGLVDLELRHDPNLAGFTISDETWHALCDSLKAHPTLQVLNLRRASLSLNLLEFRIQALVDMMQVNRSIHTIHLPSQLYIEHSLFRGSVIPYLETNRLRPRVRAIQKTCPIAYRVRVLGQALLAARTNANSFWMLLSGNPEVAFLSTIAATTPAANLLAPATATTTVNIATATRAASSAATNDATPTACLKRKARP
jgi:hypothetical protein